MNRGLEPWFLYGLTSPFTSLRWVLRGLFPHTWCLRPRLASHPLRPGRDLAANMGLGCGKGAAFPAGWVGWQLGGGSGHEVCPSAVAVTSWRPPPAVGGGGKRVGKKRLTSLPLTRALQILWSAPPDRGAVCSGLCIAGLGKGRE